MILRAVLAMVPSTHRAVTRERVRRLRYQAVQFALAYSPSDLEAAVRRLGIGDGDAVLMQSSFTAINGFDGEPQHVIDCVLDVIGPKGHLFMVSMPYDGAARDYLESAQTFDVRKTPSRMGVISESFRRRKGVLRSANPLHPVLAWGPRAEWVVEGHERLAHSCGPASPFERMLQLNTKALLFDVDLDVLTFTHYLEDLFQESAPEPVYADEPIRTAIRDRDGQRRDVSVFPFNRAAMQLRNFGMLYDALIERGQVHRERVGNTRLQSVSLANVVSTATQMVDGGTHIYSRPGESVRVKPTRHGTTRRLLYLLRHDLMSRRTLRDGRKVVRRVMAPLTAAWHAFRMPRSASHEVMRDGRGLPSHDPGIERATAAALAWLCEAQDASISNDGGVAHDYSLVDGWSASYPETTGYVIPTMLEWAKRTGDERLLDRGRAMLDWLVSIQLADGAFRAA
ncbi:MAG: AAC(3) family N-acetyltransferase [Gemmatimonadaceae bacterium]